jgi:aminoglycoside 3-N-acetyltransferase
MSLKDVLRGLTPTVLLEWNRKRKKNNRNKFLQTQKKAGKTLSKTQLIEQLVKIGIESGDTLLVHSSLSKIGYLDEGPKTLVDALISVIGESGNLLMPTSPNNVYQLNYIQNTPFFDVLKSPSRTGAITEYFRTLKGSKRSLHPTEPISAYGPLANELTKDHFNQLTPYNSNSPFYKVAQMGGKILYIGVTLDNAGTSLHLLEDAVDNFKFPVYYHKIFEFDVINEQGVKHKVKTKVHNPEQSKKRKCDDLLPMFRAENVCKDVTIGHAKTLLFDAKKMYDVMLEQYNKNGVTMYTPKGS